MLVLKTGRSRLDADGSLIRSECLRSCGLEKVEQFAARSIDEV